MWADDGTGERRPRLREPEIPEGTDVGTLQRQVWTELKTLSKDNAEGVAQHIAAAADFTEAGDLDRALEHAATATRRAGRVAAVREVHGLVHYRRGEWTKALNEFRTARRLSGSDHLVPLMADVERALGRPERAIEWGQSPEANRLARADRIELAIVVAGARQDLGQDAAALELLADLVRKVPARTDGGARVRYACADALERSGDVAAARAMFAEVIDLDTAQLTDAAERLDALDGTVIDLADPDEAQDGVPEHGRSESGPR